MKLREKPYSYQNCSKIGFWRGLEWVRSKKLSRDNHGQCIRDGLWFSCEIVQCEKTLISVFQQFSASIKKAFGLGGDWAPGYNSMKFRDFRDLLQFSKILSLRLFGNSWGNSHIPCLLLIITLRFTCDEKKIGESIKILKILWIVA